MTDFQAFPKIPRLRRDVVVTEKIDGTNAAVVIQPYSGELHNAATFVQVDGESYSVQVQSRKRFITPEDDNFGFARWVAENVDGLIRTLGIGLHFGEWWGSGIQRGYGLSEKRFSLFNAKRWGKEDLSAVAGLGVVPVITTYTMGDHAIDLALDTLRKEGSLAAPGFMNPEGIVVYHTASGQLFKVLLENDELPKGLVEAA